MKRLFIFIMCQCIGLAMFCRTIELDGNKAFSIQIDSKATEVTYLINSVFDLNGDTILFPEGTTLKFGKDGAIINGRLFGRLANKTVYAEWFGCSADSSVNNALSIENAVALSSEIILPSGRLCIDRTVELNASGVRMKGSKDGTTLMVTKPCNVFSIKPYSSDISIDNVNFCGVSSKTKACYLIYAGNHINGLSISHCSFDGGTGGVLVDYCSSDVSIVECSFRNMVYIPGAGLAANGNFKAGGAGGYGIVFQHQSRDSGSSGAIGVDKGIIRKCIFEESVIRHAIYVQSSRDIIIEKNTMYGTAEMNEEELLVDLLAKGLSEHQLDKMDIRKHMTIYDSFINLRGGENIIIRNNKSTGGIGFLRGTEDYMRKKGRNISVSKNTIKKMLLPKKSMHAIDTSFAESFIVKSNIIDN